MYSNTVAKIVDKQLKLLKEKGKTQKEVAEEAGFESSNMITHIKKGHTKLPPNRAIALAKALEIDEQNLLQMAMNERWDGVGDFFFDNIQEFRKLYLIEFFCSEIGIDYHELSKSEKEIIDLFVSKHFTI
jgi:transcriptional regulator with XRE-family HTH domain